MDSRLKITVLDGSVPDHLPGPVYHARRLLRCLGHVARLAAWRLRGGRAAYLACNGGLGLIYTLLLILPMRALRGPIYLHHHSFNYIHAPSGLMRAVTALGGKRLVHLFLCGAMRDRFTERYGPVTARVLSNSAFVPEAPGAGPRQGAQDGPVVLGHLSNLCREKGLYDFLDLLRAARDRGLAVRGVLAGPARDADAAAIRAAQAEPGLDLAWLGPVYGADKDAFYRGIDLFVFPSRYHNEAQPTVIFEAQAQARPVIATDIACIPGQLPDEDGLVPAGADFPAAALERISRFTKDGALPARQADTLLQYRHMRALAQVELDAIRDAVQAG